jgi:hypothetical protein
MANSSVCGGCGINCTGMISSVTTSSSSCS